MSTSLFTDLPIERRRQLCQSSSLAWAQNHDPYLWKPYKHSKLLDRAINHCLDDSNDDNFLAISMPPQLGKTTMCAVHAATRYFACNPNHNIQLTMYNSTIAEEKGLQAQEVFVHNAGELYGMRIDPKQKAIGNWMIDGYTGRFMCGGWGSGITGRRYDLMIFDDLFKDEREARSRRTRDNVWNFLMGTAVQRWLHNEQVRTKVIVVATRWHNDDHLGRFEKQEHAGGPIKWKRLILPDEAERDEYFGDELVLAKGELLCPQLLPKKTIERQKALTSEVNYKAIYKQRPITQDGLLWDSSLFETQWVDDWPKDVMRCVIGVDPALGRDLAKGDYAAICTLAQTHSGKLYAKADLAKHGPSQTLDRLVQACKQAPVIPDAVGIEANGFQSLLHGHAVAELAKLHLDQRCVAVSQSREDEEQMNKQDRIMLLDPFVRDRLISYVRSPGTALMVEQMRDFPSPQAHDDGPDALEICTFILAG